MSYRWLCLCRNVLSCQKISISNAPLAETTDRTKILAKMALGTKSWEEVHDKKSVSLWQAVMRPKIVVADFLLQETPDQRYVPTVFFSATKNVPTLRIVACSAVIRLQTLQNKVALTVNGGFHIFVSNAINLKPHYKHASL